MLADLDSLERRVDALSKKAKGNDKEAKETLDLVNRALALLRDGKPARLTERKPEEEKIFHSLGLLTSLPVLYVCNVEEASAAAGNAFSRKVEERAKAEGAACVVISAKIEAEIAVLSREERADYLEAVGLEGSGARPAHPRRLRAPSSGDVFHGRAERGARLDDHPRHQGAAGRRRHSHRFRGGLHPCRNHRLRRLCRCQGETGARDAGKMRLEGKDYVVHDGDVMHFRFAN